MMVSRHASFAGGAERLCQKAVNLLKAHVCGLEHCSKAISFYGPTRRNSWRVYVHLWIAAPSPYFRHQNLVKAASYDAGLAAGDKQRQANEKATQSCFHCCSAYLLLYTDSMTFLAFFSHSESGLVMHTHWIMSSTLLFLAASYMHVQRALRDEGSLQGSLGHLPSS